MLTSSRSPAFKSFASELLYYVYVLKSDCDEPSFYLGYSGDLKRRLREHNDSRTRSTRGAQWKVVYYEAHVSGKAAMQRERILKHDGRSRRALMDRIRSSLENDQRDKKGE